jgi:hypothetical protein
MCESRNAHWLVSAGLKREGHVKARIYIAGPYTKGGVAVNIRNASKPPTSLPI